MSVLNRAKQITGGAVAAGAFIAAGLGLHLAQDTTDSVTTTTVGTTDTADPTTDSGSTQSDSGTSDTGTTDTVTSDTGTSDATSGWSGGDAAAARTEGS